MENKNHYYETGQYFRKAALRRNGFYGNQNNRKLKHHLVQLWVRKKILQLIKPLYKEGDKVLDAGCGRGDFSLEISRYFKNSQVIGLDCVDEMIEIGKRLTKNKKNVSFQKGDILNMPFPNNYFDITICNNTFHHIHKDDQKKALAELSRVTKNFLILEIKNKKNLYTMIRGKKIDKLKAEVYPIHLKKLENVLVKQGFIKTAIKKYMFFEILSPWIVICFKRNG